MTTATIDVDLGIDADAGRIVLASGLDERHLDRVCRRIQREGEVGQRALAFYLHEMDLRRAYLLLGFASVVHYGRVRLDLGKSAINALVTTGRNLLELPLVDAAFAEGHLAWSRVRLLARVATAETEAE